MKERKNPPPRVDWIDGNCFLFAKFYLSYRVCTARSLSTHIQFPCGEHLADARHVVEPEGIEPSSLKTLMMFSSCLAISFIYVESSSRRGTPEQFCNSVMKRWTVAVHRVFAVLSFSESPYSKSATLFFLQTVFSGGELEVARRISLGVCLVTWIDNGCPSQLPACLHYLDFQVETCRPQNAVFLPVFRPSFP